MYRGFGGLHRVRKRVEEELVSFAFLFVRIQVVLFPLHLTRMSSFLYSRLVHQPSNHRLLRHASNPEQDQPFPSWIRSSASSLVGSTHSHSTHSTSYTTYHRHSTCTYDDRRRRRRVGGSRRRVGFGGIDDDEEGWRWVEFTSSCGWGGGG